jgi:hypothetical protein
MAAAGMHLPAHLPKKRRGIRGVQVHGKMSLGGVERGRVD